MERVIVERVAADSDPTDLAIAVVDARRGAAARFIHSTSWRYEAGRVVLTYAALVPEASLREPVSYGFVDSWRAGGTGADPRPEHLAIADVVRHAVRHLAFLVVEDSAVAAGLPADLKAALAAFRPTTAGRLGA